MITTFLRRWLILSHRYLGIALSLLFVIWFASGITMIYAGGMPRLSPESRLAKLPTLDPARVQLTPAEAARRAGIGRNPGRVVLLNVMERPAYRFGGAQSVTVFADDGEMLEELDEAQARTVASHFMALPPDKLHDAGLLTRADQWTIGAGRGMPLYKFHVDDPARTALYVSAELGEVTLETTRRTRTLAWLGTIPHWFYFAALRLNQPLWSTIVVWTSGLGCVLAALGLVLGFVQFRRSKPFRLSASIPYSGWMRWHYVSGAIFGLFTLTWVFSGLLSMEPFAWTRATGLEVRRDVFTGGAVDLSRFPKMDLAAWTQMLDGRALKEVEFARIQDDPYYIVRYTADVRTASARERLHQPYTVGGRGDQDRLLVAAATLAIRQEAFSVDSLMTRLKAALPNVPILEQQVLDEYDSYYYSRAGQSPLPVLRVKFGDPAETWFYIDPQTSQILAEVNRLNRVERWLYNGLHSLDFSFWYGRRPLWDIGMLVLLVGGLVSSGAGFYIGVRRLGRAARSA